MLLLGYLSSIFMGLSLGLMGGGGSILTVPILVYLFGVEPLTATAYSLFVVGLTSLVGGLAYFSKGEVDLKTGILFGIPSLLGVYLARAFVVPGLPDPVFTLGNLVLSKALLVMAIFAILMIAASFTMIRSKSVAISTKKEFSATQKLFLILVEGFVVGGVTGFVGAGGGFLIIPALVVLVGMPMKRAVGTSLFIIAAKSLIGFTADLQTHSMIDWKLLLSVAAIAVVGLFLGMTLSKQVSEKALKKAFGYFVLTMGAFILLDQLNKL